MNDCGCNKNLEVDSKNMPLVTVEVKKGYIFRVNGSTYHRGQKVTVNETALNGQEHKVEVI